MEKEGGYFMGTKVSLFQPFHWAPSLVVALMALRAFGVVDEEMSWGRMIAGWMLYWLSVHLYQYCRKGVGL